MEPDPGSEHVAPPDGEHHGETGEVPAAAEMVSVHGPSEFDPSTLPRVIGLEVTRILDAARVAGEQIRVQAVKEAEEALSEAAQARDDVARAHEEARLAREDAERAREEAISVRGRVARLQAEFTGLLREMEPLSGPAPPPAGAAEVGGPDPAEPRTSMWSPAWGITEGEGHGGDVSHEGAPGPDGSDREEEPADEGSTVVVPEAAVAENEGEDPGGVQGSAEADAEGREAPPRGDPSEDADDNVPVLERLRRLATS